MVVLLVVVMVAGLLLLEYLRYREAGRQEHVREEEHEPEVTYVDGVAVPQGLAFHPAHTWARAIDSQTVVVGVDDFARRLLGKIDRVILPMTNVEVEAGQGCTLVRSGRRVAPVACPISGEVIAVNNELKERPELVSGDPYGRGWLFRIRSWRLTEQLSSLLGGDVAREWMRLSTQRLRTAFGGIPALVMQDGGELLDDIGSQFDCERWVKLVREHLGTEALECNEERGRSNGPSSFERRE